MKIQQTLKSINFDKVNITSLIGISILISIPTIVLASNIALAIPVLVIVLLSVLFGERFIIAIVLITLFTLVGELDRTLRSIVQLVDFTILGIFFLKRYGLEFESYPKIPKSTIYFLILYASAFLISSAMSKYPFYGIDIFAKQAAFFLIAYIFYSFIKSETDIKDYFVSIIVVTSIFTTLFIITFIGEGYDLISLVSTSRVRITALTGNIEAATNFFVISFPILIYYLIISRNSLSKKSIWMILLYSFMGLVLAMSRSAILGIMLSTAIMFFMIRRKRFYQFLFSVLIVVLIFIVVSPLNDIITQLLRLEEGLSVRDYLWLMTVNIIKDHPVFGLGPGAYPYELINYYPFMLDEYYGKVFLYFADSSLGLNLAHNIFLVFFSDMGLLGLATILMLPYIYFRIGIKTLIKYKNGSKESYYLIIALFTAGTSVIFRNIFNSIGLLYIGGIHTDLPFWLVFSSLIYFYRTPLKKTSMGERKNLEKS